MGTVPSTKIKAYGPHHLSLWVQIQCVIIVSPLFSHGRTKCLKVVNENSLYKLFFMCYLQFQNFTKLLTYLPILFRVDNDLLILW